MVFPIPRSMKHQLTSEGKIAALMVNLLRLTLAVTIASFLLGCKADREFALGPPFSSYRAGQLTDYGVRRVALVPFSNMTDYPHVHDEFTQLLAAELNAAGHFEVVSIPEHEVDDPELTPPSSGHYDEHLLIYLGKKYGVDAVIFGRVSQFHPYWPPRIGIVMHMVDVREGNVLASTDGIWDARNKYVAGQAEQYYTQLHAQDTLPHSELMLRSPNYFQKFVAYQVTERLTQNPVAEVSEAPTGSLETLPPTKN